MKVLREWFIDVPWGKLAFISWGDPKGYPVLLVHGREDSAATFIPLLQLLPKHYYYVGVDMPGNGKSDPFPPGILLSRFHFVLGVDYAVRHLKWNKFIYIAHSMGTEHGLFYNAIYPGRMTKMVLLDPTPAIRNMFTKSLPYLYQGFYETYYENYSKYNKSVKAYTAEQAMRAVMNARGLNEEETEIILSRNLHPVGDNLYNLSWHRALKIAAPFAFTEDFYRELFSKRAPPMFIISATMYRGRVIEGLEKVFHFLDKLKEKIPHFYHNTVNQGHDLHFTHPELIADDVKQFLKKDFGTLAKAKL